VGVLPVSGLISDFSPVFFDAPMCCKLIKLISGRCFQWRAILIILISYGVFNAGKLENLNFGGKSNGRH